MKLGIDVAAWWRPAARNVFDRRIKPAIPALFDRIGGAALKSRYASVRKFDLATSAEKLFAGEVFTDAEVNEAANSWLLVPKRHLAKPFNAMDEVDRSSDAKDVEPAGNDIAASDHEQLDKAA